MIWTKDSHSLPSLCERVAKTSCLGKNVKRQVEFTILFPNTLLNPTFKNLLFDPSKGC